MRTYILLAAIAAVAAPAHASEQANVMSLIAAYNDHGYTPKLCAPEASIIDDFGQHAWLGPKACADWLNAFSAFMKTENIASPKVTLGKPEHVAVDGNRAYAVIPATFSYQQKGKAMTEKGTWTFALQKMAGGWRIGAWTWSQH